jgi:dienelactone hydrolase
VRLPLPSLAAPGGAAIELDGWWYPAAVEGPAPVVLMLHGCGGMLNGRGQPTVRMREYAALLNAQGWHALALDSLSARGEKEICTQRIGTRRVTQTERRRDALGALRWLASQPGVDASRLALLGWSHGGSAVLAATNLNHADVARAPLRPKLAVAFYPGCEADLRRGYRPSAEVLLLLGLADDWTPAAPCQALAQTGGPAVTVLAWEGAVHGFDGTAPVRHRGDVPNGATPGQGVHVGGHPQARPESQQALLAALQRAFAR